MKQQNRAAKMLVFFLVVVCLGGVSLSCTRLIQASGLAEEYLMCEDIHALGFSLESHSITAAKVEATYIDAARGSEVYVTIENVSDATQMVRDYYKGMTVSPLALELSDELEAEGWVYSYDLTRPCGLETDNRFSVMRGHEADTGVIFNRMQAMDSQTLIVVEGEMVEDLRVYPYDDEGTFNPRSMLLLSRNIDVFERHAMKVADRLAREEKVSSAERSTRFNEQGRIIFSEEDLYVPGMSGLGMEMSTTAPYKAEDGWLVVRYVPAEEKDWRMQVDRLTLSIIQYEDGEGAESFRTAEPSVPVSIDSSTVVREETDTRKTQVYYVGSGSPNRPGKFWLTRYVLYDEDTYLWITGNLSEDIVHIDRAADVLENYAIQLLDSIGTREEEQVEHELYGRVSNYRFAPMRDMVVQLTYNGKMMETTTDQHGFYSFPIDELGHIAELRLPMVCRVGDNTIFSMKWYEFNYEFPINSVNDLQFYASVDYIQEEWRPDSFMERQLRELGLRAEDLGDRELYGLESLGMLYWRMHQAYTFFQGELGVTPLPVQVLGGKTGLDMSLYNATLLEIGIAENYQRRRTYHVWLQDLMQLQGGYVEWHEYSHHLMRSVYGADHYPALAREVPEENWAGYINHSTSDSWAEGFAVFMPLVIADYVFYTDDPGYHPGVDPHWGSLAVNYQAWGHRGRHETLAVAGILWDIYYGIREKDQDSVQLSLQEIWSVLKDKHQNMYSVYQGFVEAFPEEKENIDQIFINHGFFADTVEGNYILDPHEPRRDDGYFIDLAPEIIWEPGKAVGQATNYERPERHFIPNFPGSYIKTPDEHNLYQIHFEFPEHPQFNHTFYQWKESGRIYIPTMPEQYEINVTVEGFGHRVNTGNPLTFTNEDYFEYVYAGDETGYLLEHRFDIEGPRFERPGMHPLLYAIAEDEPDVMDRDRAARTVSEPLQTTQYTLTTGRTGQGTITPAEGTHTFDEDMAVPIGAQPASGWEFVRWEGDVDGSAASQVVMDRDRTVRAVFEETARLAPINPTHGAFGVTAERYADSSDWDQIILEIFGPEYRVADWNDLKDFHSGGGDLLALYDGLGLTDHGSSAYVTKDGSRVYSGNRHYFASRHEHNKPGRYLAHDHINNYQISLGSWYGQRHILVIRQSGANDDGNHSEIHRALDLFAQAIAMQNPTQAANQVTDPVFGDGGPATRVEFISELEFEFSASDQYLMEFRNRRISVAGQEAQVRTDVYTKQTADGRSLEHQEPLVLIMHYQEDRWLIHDFRLP